MVQWITEPRAVGLGQTDEQRFAEARSYFPSCYSREFDDCLEKKNLNTFPNCLRMKQLWTTNEQDPVYKKLSAEVQKMPYCSEQAQVKEFSLNLLGVAAGAVAGFLLARAFR